MTTQYHYTLTRKDLTLAILYLQGALRKQLNKENKGFLIGYFVSFIVFGVLLAIGLTWQLELSSITIVEITIGLLVLEYIAFVGLQVAISKGWASLAKENGPSLGEITLIVDANQREITIEKPGQIKTTFPFTSILKIEQTKEYYFIFIDSHVVWAVPKRDLKDINPFADVNT